MLKFLEITTASFILITLLLQSYKIDLTVSPTSDVTASAKASITLLAVASTLNIFLNGKHYANEYVLVKCHIVTIIAFKYAIRFYFMDFYHSPLKNFDLQHSIMINFSPSSTPHKYDGAARFYA